MSSENKLVQLKQKIEHLNQELATINHTPPIPELINTTNILRTNEYLTHANEKKTQIISSYNEYVTELEAYLRSAFERKLAFLKKTRARLEKKTKKKPKKKHIKKSKKKKLFKKRRR
jgi:hypothetical protein